MQLLDASGRPTADAVTRYTEGDCWHLAFELAVKLGAPLVAVVHETDPTDWVHVTVDLGRESLLDVTGVRSRDEMLRTWTTRLKRPMVLRELGRFYALQDMLEDLDACRFDMMLTRKDEEDCSAVADALMSVLSRIPAAL